MYAVGTHSCHRSPQRLRPFWPHTCPYETPAWPLAGVSPAGQAWCDPGSAPTCRTASPRMLASYDPPAGIWHESEKHQRSISTPLGIWRECGEQRYSVSATPGACRDVLGTVVFSKYITRYLVRVWGERYSVRTSPGTWHELGTAVFSQ